VRSGRFGAGPTGLAPLLASHSAGTSEPGEVAVLVGCVLIDLDGARTPPNPGHPRASTEPRAPQSLRQTQGGSPGRFKVLSITEHVHNDDLGRIAYQVTYQRHLSPTIPATATLPEGMPRVTYVVVERQAAGDWLVLSQTHHLDPVE
jgi:hypothetical protein